MLQRELFTVKDYYDIVFWENRINRDADGKVITISRADDRFDFKLKDKYLLDTNQDNTVEIGVTCEYDLKKIEDVDPETGEIKYGNESFDKYEDEIVENNRQWTNEDSAYLSVTCTGSNIIDCYETSQLCNEKWVKKEGEWESYYEISPDDYEGYAFLPVNIQITRAKGTLHIVNQ